MPGREAGKGGIKASGCMLRSSRKVQRNNELWSNQAGMVMDEAR